jgi:hypothetical protein
LSVDSSAGPEMMSGARFVDEDGADFVDDHGEVMATLNAIREVVLHVVA